VILVEAEFPSVQEFEFVGDIDDCENRISNELRVKYLLVITVIAIFDDFFAVCYVNKLDD
jgi:hypothetical protein